MQIYPDCYVCALRMALMTARAAEADEATEWEVLNRSLAMLQSADRRRTTPEIAASAYHLARECTGVDDPFAALKQASTRQALELYPRLKAIVAAAPDPLDVAIRLAIAGNIIDPAIVQSYDLWETIERALEQSFGVDHREAFRRALGQASQVLYLADNAGETVFDRILIETMDRPVLYAVRSAPILNDATREDALAAGIDRVAQIIESGARVVGTLLSDCTEAFRRLLADSDMIIAKGQGNFETLSRPGSGIFFLLQVKCPLIGKHLGAPLGSLALRYEA